MNTPALMKLTYQDKANGVLLTGYADTLVYDGTKEKKTLCVLRFGGYPEEVEGMAAAIFGGAAVDMELSGETVKVDALTRQYRRSITHDGSYAIATLIAEDDAQQAQDNGGDDETADVPKDLPPRTNYIFCTPGDKQELYEAVDQKTAAPLIPEFQDYVLRELVKRKILRPLQVVSQTQTSAFDAWALRCTDGDKNILAVLNDGLKQGDISIPGASPGGLSPLDELDSVTQYLNTFGVSVAERIKELFVPLYNPATEPISQEVLEIDSYIHQHAGYHLYDAQLAVAEAIKRRLMRSKVGLIVAECGSGKTKIGASAIAAVAAGLHAEQRARGAYKTFNVVLCPSHITDKWVREVQESLPDTFAAVVRSITEFDLLYSLYEKGDKSCYAIISKEKARDGYMRAPAVRWNERKQGFVCPDCGEVVETNITRDGAVYKINANQFFFKHENSFNHKCEACGSPLWTALNPDVRTDRTAWIKLADYGFVYRSRARKHLRKAPSADVFQRISQIVDFPDAPYPARGARRAFPLSTYIKRYYKGNIDGLICDELHQYNNKSAQGDAMGELFGMAKKVVGMTATLINGYSSGIFHLLYRIVPYLMKKDGKEYLEPTKFDAEYGVIQNVYEEKDPAYNTNRRVVRTKKATRQLPGVSPLVYSNFLLEYAAFLSLTDMGKDLPEYEEIPVPLDMPNNVELEYKRIETELRSVLKHDKKAARKILSAYLNLLTAYPDQPYNQKPIVHPIDGYDIVTPKDTASFDTLLPKDKKVLEIVKRKIEAGEKVLIYTNWTRLDTQRKLLKLMTEAGYRTEILPPKIKPAGREKWVNDRLATGLEVLITNPSLVETGLDLNAFTTLIFYDTGYKLFTLRQASRRSWRINQTAPRVEVYMFYYKNTMQHKAMKLMASKLAVAGIIEGNFTDEGLAAMSDVQDMTTMMAKELMLGIKDNVEDISAAFKRMAILHPRAEVVPALPVFTDGPAAIEEKAVGTRAVPRVTLVEFTFPVSGSNSTSEPEVWNPFTAAVNTPAGRKHNPSAGDEDQLTLFELAEKSA